MIHKRGEDTKALVNNINIIEDFIVKIEEEVALQNYRLGSSKWRFPCKSFIGDWYQEPHQKGRDKAGLERS